MDYTRIIEDLEQEWSKPDGFFGKLREGAFDEAGLRRVEGVLNRIEPTPEDSLPRRVVALTWLAPLFMTWQRERVAAAGDNVRELEKAVTKIENILLERVLGGP